MFEFPSTTPVAICSQDSMISVLVSKSKRLEYLMFEFSSTIHVAICLQDSMISVSSDFLINMDWLVVCMLVLNIQK